MLSKMIFGCGTGRCGTYTLYRILEAQQNVAAGHEGFSLPWDVDVAQLWYFLIGIQARCESPIFANSSFVWMRYAGKIMSEIPNPKFICLKRPREQVVNSFLKHIPNLNHWTDPTSSHWNISRDTRAIQSIMWPKYDESKANAIGRYWDSYYSQAGYFQHRFPDNFRIFDMKKVLNTTDGQREMLEFAGIEKSAFFLHRKLNALGKPKGHLNPEDDHVYPRQGVFDGPEAA